jgi:hypothetical protein
MDLSSTFLFLNVETVSGFRDGLLPDLLVFVLNGCNFLWRFVYQVIFEERSLHRYSQLERRALAR